MNDVDSRCNHFEKKNGLLAALGLQRIVVKCTAAIFFRTRTVDYLVGQTVYDSISSKRAHPLPPGICQALFHFSFPTVGHLPKKVRPGVRHCQKQLGLSNFKSRLWFHSNVCKYLHSCFHLRTWDHKKKNKHGTWKRCSFSWWKAIWAITDPIKIH